MWLGITVCCMWNVACLIVGAFMITFFLRVFTMATDVKHKAVQTYKHARRNTWLLKRSLRQYRRQSVEVRRKMSNKIARMAGGVAGGVADGLADGPADGPTGEVPGRVLSYDDTTNVQHKLTQQKTD